jgi:hypothetical protein
VTRAPERDCLPAGPPSAYGPKVRKSRDKLTYFREDPDGSVPTPQECFADLGTFGVQAADAFCPLHLFVPSAGGQQSSAPEEMVHKAPPAPRAAGAVPWPPKAQAEAEPAQAPVAATDAACASQPPVDAAEPPAALPPPP